MTSYASPIDHSEGQTSQGIRFTALVGLGGCTAGQPLKYDGTTAGTVVASTTTTDYVVGVAATTQSAGDQVMVLSDGCRVTVPYTLTMNTKVGVGTSGTAGTLVDYSAGVMVGLTETSATLASIIRIRIQLVMA